jgi:threonine/homoserine/homoserine lactone efflux protein
MNIGMELDRWLLFVAMSFVVSATPGPNMLYVMTTSAVQGFRASITAMAGCMAALMAMMSLSAAGVGALLQTSPALFDALRLCGAAYLAYLGFRLWRSPVADGDMAVVTAPRATQVNHRAVFAQGFLVAASNPKAILFAAAFFPQFIRPDAPALSQFSILLATFAVIEIAWYVAYALSGDRLSRYLKKASFMRAFNRLTGGVFVGFALLMADVRR